MNAFNGCSALTELFLPKSVASIGNNAFANTEVTIAGYEGSFAHSYAVENAMSFKVVEDSDEVILGDLDGDMTVNAKDVNIIRRVVAGVIPMTEQMLRSADLDKDGTVNGKDSNFLSRKTAGVIECICVLNQKSLRSNSQGFFILREDIL